MAETTKKAKAAKPKEAAKPQKAVRAALETTASKTTGSKATGSRKTEVKKSASKTPKAATGIAIVKPVSQEEVALLAHRFWTERGYKHGHHHEDWLRAERELRGKAS